MLPVLVSGTFDRVAGPRTEPDDPSGRLRFRQAIQRSRAATYLLSVSLALIFMALRALPMRPSRTAAICVVAWISAALFWWLAKLQHDRGWKLDLDLGWLLTDVVLISWAIHETGGFASPWFIWYLGPLGAAAFASDGKAVVVTAVANVVCYLGMLSLRGELREADGTLFLALARMVFLHGAALFFLQGVADLKEKRRVIKRLKEEESRKVAELTRLATALDQRTRELSDANVKIREADRLKSQFLANMSHELRTPLNSIIGFSDVLKSRLGATLDPRYVKFLENIHGSGRHLLEIINDILDLSKIEAGKMDVLPEPFELRGFVEGVAHVMKGVADKRSVSIVVEVPGDLPPLEADPVRFKQILYNLVSNAVKFSPDGSTVTVTAALVAAAESPLHVESISVAVLDHGIGIDAKDHALVFQEFRQADGSSHRRYEGTGLGLALVRSLVTLQHGAVTLRSAPGQGSTFTVFLPVRFQGLRGPARPAVDVAAGDHEGRRILVVEDDPTAYERIAGALAAASYIPLRAGTGEEALRMAKTLRPAAITLDLVLPGLDGWSVLKLLKSDPDTRPVPVVIISLLDNRDLGMALGADDYLLKPVEPARLIERLESLVLGSSATPADVLLVDDDPAVHELLEAFLTPHGYRLRHAFSGPEGLEMATREPPALIVLDLMMEGMDGFEVATRLRARPETADLPVLVLTARDLSVTDRDRLRGKITQILQKTGTTDGALIEIVASVLRRAAR